MKYGIARAVPVSTDKNCQSLSCRVDSCWNFLLWQPCFEAADLPRIILVASPTTGTNRGTLRTREPTTSIHSRCFVSRNRGAGRPALTIFFTPINQPFRHVAVNTKYPVDVSSSWQCVRPRKRKPFCGVASFLESSGEYSTRPTVCIRWIDDLGREPHTESLTLPCQS